MLAMGCATALAVITCNVGCGAVTDDAVARDAGGEIAVADATPSDGDSFVDTNVQDAPADAPDAGPCGPSPRAGATFLAAAENPSQMAISGSYLYWVEQAAGRVMRVERDGGCPLVVADGLKAPVGIAPLPSGGVVWTVYGSLPDANDGSVMTFDGSSAKVVIGSQHGPLPIVVDTAGVIYWSTAPTKESFSLWKFDTKLSSLSVVPALKIAISRGTLFWTDGTSIMTLPSDGGLTTTFASGQVGARHIAADATAVYWTLDGDSSGDTGGVMRQDIGATTSSVVAAKVFKPGGLAVDSAGVYWTTKGAVFKTDSSGAPAIVADKLGAVAVTLDDANVYWGGSAGIYRVKK